MENDYSILKEFDYPPQEVSRGYTDRTLYVNLSSREIISKSVSQAMKDMFTFTLGCYHQ